MFLFFFGNPLTSHATNCSNQKGLKVKLKVNCCDRDLRREDLAQDLWQVGQVTGIMNAADWKRDSSVVINKYCQNPNHNSTQHKPNITFWLG